MAFCFFHKEFGIGFRRQHQLIADMDEIAVLCYFAVVDTDRGQ